MALTLRPTTSSARPGTKNRPATTWAAGAVAALILALNAYLVWQVILGG